MRTSRGRGAAERWPDETPIRVRMALHTGAVEVRAGDCFGPPLNRVARLLSTGFGGQTLVSQVTGEHCRDGLPDGASLRDLGLHRLKDLARPERVFELRHASLRGDLPPIKSLSTLRNNLKQQLTSFIGRGHAAFDRAWLEGRASTLERASEIALAQLVTPT